MTKLNRLLIASSAVSLLGFMSFSTLAHGNDRGDIHATVGGAHISIDYGRPSLKGRDPLKLIQPGKVWRIGADASTTIESDKDLSFGETRVPKGKHILLARYAGPGKWDLVVSSKSWNEYETSAKIAEMPLTFEEGSDSVETVSIELSSQDDTGVVKIAWGKLRLTGSFSVAQ